MVSKTYTTPPKVASIKSHLPRKDMVKNFIFDYVNAKQPAFDDFIGKNVRENGAIITFDFVTKYTHYFVSSIHFIDTDWYENFTYFANFAILQHILQI